MAQQPPEPVREVAKGAVEGFLEWLTRHRPRRRQRSRPISVSAFLSAGTKHHPPEQIPPRLRDFVSRRDPQMADLVARVVALLDRSGRVILWGDGGVGKSTLAYEAAAAYCRKRPVGLIWASADAVPDFNLAHFVQELARLLNCKPDFNAVCAALQRAPHLVVLDNTDTIGDNVLFGRLAQSFPAPCRLLVTSRKVDGRFQGLGDQVEIDVMRLEEALTYTRQRARSMDPPPALTDEQVTRIVREAGRNPEAIWWLLGHAQSGRLDEALSQLPTGTGLPKDDRERGPERIFGRTWRELAQHERLALCVLSLFPQAEPDLVAAATGDAHIRDTLVTLWRWHLLHQDGTGKAWWVTGLTREMAQRRLYPVLDELAAAMSAQDEVGRAAGRALAHFAASGSVAEVLHRMGHWDEWARYGEAGLTAARSYADKALLARAAHNVAIAHDNQGRLKEAERLYGESLALKRELGNKSGIATTLHQLGNMAYSRGELKEAERLYGESLALERELGDKSGIAGTLHQLGMLAQDRGDLVEAERLYGESLALKRELGNKRGIASTLHQLGNMARSRGDLKEAERLYGESLTLSRELGDNSSIADTLHQLGNMAYSRGDLVEAERLYGESLALKRELGDKRGIASTLHALGMLAQDRGDPGEAERLYGESLALERELGDKRGMAGTLHQLGNMAYSRGDLVEAERLYGESLALKRELGDKRGIAYTLHQLGMLAQDRGDLNEAERLYGESLALERELGDKSGIAITLHQLGMLAQDRGDLNEAERLYGESLALERELGDKSGIAITLAQTGLLRERQERYAEAAALLQEALQLFRELGSPTTAQAERDLARVRGRLGKGGSAPQPPG